MSEKSIHSAFHEAYANMDNPKKNATNPAFRSKYANLEEMLNVTRPILAAEGFALVQEPVSKEESIGVHTRLLHSSGESLDFGAYAVPLAKHDAQGAGSAITYTRRYAIAAIFGLAQEDDDGNAAVKPPDASSGAKASKPAPAALDDFTLPFGAHKGQTLRSLTGSATGLKYLAWVADKFGLADDGTENPKYAERNEKARQLAANIYASVVLAAEEDSVPDEDDAPEFDENGRPF